MNISRLELFAGKPCKTEQGHFIYSPTVEQVLNIGEHVYYFYLIMSSFDKEKILFNIFEINEEDYEPIKDEDDYKVLIQHPLIIKYLSEALSFFTNQEISFDIRSKTFMIGDSVFCNYENYREIASLIRILNGASDDKKEKIKFRREKAKQLFAKLNELRKKYKKEEKEEGIELKDILSILCNAEGNGINIFNVFKLTIYQVYEQFERMSMKESHTRLLPVWANGNLDKEHKLPEWIKKSKL